MITEDVAVMKAEIEGGSGVGNDVLLGGSVVTFWHLCSVNSGVTQDLVKPLSR